MSSPVTSVARVEDVQIFLKDPVFTIPPETPFVQLIAFVPVSVYLPASPSITLCISEV